MRSCRPRFKSQISQTGHRSENQQGQTIRATATDRVLHLEAALLQARRVVDERFEWESFLKSTVTR